MIKLLILLLTASPAHAALSQIGAAAAVSGSVKAVSQGAEVGRIVQSGKPLYLNDHVTTDDKGRLQVLLADETVFTLGPNSDMVLDEFVYDSASGAGQVSAKISKGVFRFVTGKVARKDPAKMKVKLSVGTIGIRGTTVVGSVDPVAGRDTVVLMDNGMAIVSNGGGSVELRAPGFGTIMTLPNIPPPPPAPMGGVAAGIMGQLTAPRQPGTPAPPVTDPAGGGMSAGELAGQNEANLFNSAQTSQILAGLSQATYQEITQTIQQNLNSANGISSWDDMRGMSGMGQIYYLAYGTYAGISGITPAAGALELNLVVDFTAREISGGDIYMTGDITDSTTINLIPFSVLSGPAIVPLDFTQGSISNYAFDNSSLVFYNTAAGTAAEVQANVSYNNGDGTIGAGTMIGGQAPLPQ